MPALFCQSNKSTRPPFWYATTLMWWTKTSFTEIGRNGIRKPILIWYLRNGLQGINIPQLRNRNAIITRRGNKMHHLLRVPRNIRLHYHRYAVRCWIWGYCQRCWRIYWFHCWRWLIMHPKCWWCHRSCLWQWDLFWIDRRRSWLQLSIRYEEAAGCFTLSITWGVGVCDSEVE